MPLIYLKEIKPKTVVGVWDTSEDINFFIEDLKLTIDELDYITNLKSHRQKEWLSSRYLCKQLLKADTRLPIQKDDCGKPFVMQNGVEISISHSKNKTAVIISDVLVGIDIQKHTNRISSIQHKFISNVEHSHIDKENLIESYHLFWGAKECMYKAYGKRKIDFKIHMHLFPFNYFQNQLELRGWLKKGDVAQDYLLFTEKIEDYYLVYSILDNA